MKQIIPIKPCPWCGSLPKLNCFLNNKTWTPFIECVSNICDVKPKARHISIRKKQKKNPLIIECKMIRCINYWNHNNPTIATHGMEFDFEEISKGILPCLS